MQRQGYRLIFITWLVMGSLTIIAVLFGQVSTAPLLRFSIGNTLYQADMRTALVVERQAIPYQTLLSPDGTWIARIDSGRITRDDPGARVFVAEADTPEDWIELTQIDGLYWTGTYLWALDSQSILGFLPATLDDMTLGTQIIKIDIETGVVTTLSDHDYQMERPIISPDQNFVALATTVEGDFDYMLVVNLHDGSEQRIDHIPPYLLRQTVPVWSADGRYLYYLRADDPQRYDLWRFDPISGESNRVIENTGRPPSIAAGGDHVTLNYLSGLVVVDLSSGTPYNFPAAFNLVTHFSPDGRYLAYNQSFKGGAGMSEITIIDTTTMQPVSNIHVESFVGALSWQKTPEAS